MEEKVGEEPRKRAWLRALLTQRGRGERGEVEKRVAWFQAVEFQSVSEDTLWTPHGFDNVVSLALECWMTLMKVSGKTMFDAKQCVMFHCCEWRPVRDQLTSRLQEQSTKPCSSSCTEQPARHLGQQTSSVQAPGVRPVSPTLFQVFFACPMISNSVCDLYLVHHRSPRHSIFDTHLEPGQHQ